MKKYLGLFLLIPIILLPACNNGISVTTPGSLTNRAEYVAPTFTSRPIATPLPKSKNGEVVLILRSKSKPYETLILRLPNKCLLSDQACSLNGNLLGVLPQSLSQVSQVYWVNGDTALFWDDNTGDIYELDGNKGTFSVVKQRIPKARGTFIVSPSGEYTIFEIQKNDYETDLVIMDNLSGDIVNLNIPIPGAKYVSQWIDNNRVLFWSEVSEGKGYLVDLNVYIFDISSHSVQAFDIGRDWIKTQTSIPVFSPNRNFMTFTTGNQTIIRNASTAFEHTLGMRSEKILWSMDSNFLAIYNSDKEIYVVRVGGDDLQKVYSLAGKGEIEDWMWLPDNTHILIIIVHDDGEREIGFLSVTQKTFAVLNLSLLKSYVPISISFRP